MITIFTNYDFAAFIPGMEDGRFSRDVTNENFVCCGKINLDQIKHTLWFTKHFLYCRHIKPFKNICLYDSVGTVIMIMK